MRSRTIQRLVPPDPVASERNSADHTAIGVWTVTPENDLLLLEVVRSRFGVERIELKKVSGPIFRDA
jgi:hypothetical protein